MADVTSTIIQIVKQKNAFITSGNDAVRRILEELLAQVRRELGNAALSSWDSYRMKQLQDAIERAIADADLRMQQALAGDMKRIWDLGQESVYKPLNESGIYTGFDLGSSTIQTLESFTFHKIAGVTRDAFARISAELTLGALGGKTPAEVAAAIGENLKSPGVFQTIADRAEVIVKTELGRVFSIAGDLRLQKAGEYVDGLEKQWIHAGHPAHPRWSHVAVDGQHVPFDEPYKLEDKDGYRLMFPRDPNADISEVINCGCDSVPWKKEWGLPEKSGLSGMIYKLAS